jgi:tetratricopeptide (TPR) repeat protein
VDPFERARVLYEQAVFDGDADAVAIADQVLDGAEAALSLARGRIVHARFLADRRDDPGELVLFERAALLYRQLGDLRGEGEALSWVGTYHQVVRDDVSTAQPFLERARELAAAAGNKLTLSYAERHLGFCDMATGDLASARKHFDESVRLRREIGFMPGVAAGVLALAQLAAKSGDSEHARELFDEAASIAADSGAHGIERWIERARRKDV